MNETKPEKGEKRIICNRSNECSRISEKEYI
jgi:hypothetical protein